jgi:glutamate/tyrosine decarboxylase-like PLP-dependent enzyme
MGIAADALVAAFNPQLAAWSHSPFAIEVEQHLIRAFGAKFGYDPATTDGAFCSGGAEANHTALLAALTHKFPDYPSQGVGGARPVFYASAESHHSFLKAARTSGIGYESLHPIDDIARDRAAGLTPFMIVGTAGTTNAGIIDPLPELARIARSENLWFHVDAAWGGAAALVPELRPLLDGIELSDSITFDAHKFLSVPMGAGIYLTRHPDILDRTFRTQTAYMPREALGLDVVDPHLHTMQWSRRAIGMKLFLSLLVAGWDGYAEAIRHQTAMGALLRENLRAAGWTIENDSPLPVVCFTHPSGADPHAIAMRIVSSGEAWISTTIFTRKPVLRACITNYRTQPSDIEALIESLARALVKRPTAQSDIPDSLC